MSRLLIIFLGILLVLTMGCSPPSEPVVSESALPESRRAWTQEEAEAVIEYAEGEDHGPVQEVLNTRHGVVVVFVESVVSYGADPVRHLWSHALEGEITVAAVSPDEDVLLVRHQEDIGPFSRERVLLLHTMAGRVLFSESLGMEGQPDEVQLAGNDRQVILSDGLVEARTPPFRDTDWLFDPSEICSTNGAEEIGMVASTSGVIVSYACAEDDVAHVRALHADSGELLWKRHWDKAEVPRIHMMFSSQIVGAELDPVTRIFDEGTTGNVLFMQKYTGSVMGDVNPWNNVPGVAPYLEEPIQDPETLPDEIIFLDGFSAETRVRMLLGATRSLMENEEAPVGEEDLDDQLYVDGELMEHSGQWGAAPDIMVGVIERNLTEALE